MKSFKEIINEKKMTKKENSIWDKSIKKISPELGGSVLSKFEDEVMSLLDVSDKVENLKIDDKEEVKVWKKRRKFMKKLENQFFTLVNTLKDISRVG